MKILLYQELLIQTKIHNLAKYIILFFGFCIVSIALTNSHDDIQKFGAIFSLITIPLCFIGLVDNVIKLDIDDGTLEYLLTCALPEEIILSKFIVIGLISFVSFALVTPLLYVIFNLTSSELIALLASGVMLTMLCSALILLIASVQGYFRSNTSFFAILIMPLVLPNLILGGIFIHDPQNIYLPAIMLGINLVILPPIIRLCGYLINNIYNI